jgi:deazaflavin-dependent oxidoreductase (nitroreductase family)
MSFNDFAGRLLRSRFYWMMGRGTLLITVTGRKSGQPLTLPVNFYRLDGDLWISSRRSRRWWRNLRANPQVALWVGGRQRAARGEALLDETAVADGLARIFAHEPALARALHVRLTNGAPDPGDLQRVVADRLLVKIHLD